MADRAPDQRAISPVLGTILMVAIVVILAALVGGLMLEFSSETPEETPITAVEFDWEVEEGAIVVTHRGGDTIDPDRLELHGPGEIVSKPAELSAGESLVIEVADPDGDLDLVYTDPGGDSVVVASGDNPVTDTLDFPPEITLAYEDLEPADSDFDYGDWVLELETQITGFVAQGDKYAQEMTIEFDPRARYAGFQHQQYLVPDDLGDGEYELTVTDGDGTVVDTRTDSVTADERIEILNSGDALDAHTDCDTDRRATLHLDLDSPARIPDDPINETHQHGSGLPFDPVMEPSGNDEEIGVGDARLLTVQTGWQWPDDGVHIAEVYGPVGPDDPDDTGDPPIFEERTWFESPSGPQQLNDCD